jgi:hypothetical protein
MTQSVSETLYFVLKIRRWIISTIVTIILVYHRHEPIVIIQAYFPILVVFSRKLLSSPPLSLRHDSVNMGNTRLWYWFRIHKLILSAPSADFIILPSPGFLRKRWPRHWKGLLRSSHKMKRESISSEMSYANVCIRNNPFSQVFQKYFRVITLFYSGRKITVHWHLWIALQLISSQQSLENSHSRLAVKVIFTTGLEVKCTLVVLTIYYNMAICDIIQSLEYTSHDVKEVGLTSALK